MTAAGFRRLVLKLEGALEGSHMGRPDFRVNGRIFATLHTGNGSGMVKVSPAQQQELVRGRPDVFAPENGAWGRQGCTRVELRAADEEILGEAVTLAWQNATTARAKRSRARSRRTS